MKMDVFLSEANAFFVNENNRLIIHVKLSASFI